MKRIICCIVAILMVISTTVMAATYYDVNVEGLTAGEKQKVTEWLEEKGYDYDVNSYSSSDYSSTNKKVMIVEELSSSEKTTLINWLKTRDYDYTIKNKNGYYNVNIEYTSSTKNTLENYLDNKGYDYGGSSYSSGSSRNGSVYLVTNNELWYVDGDDIEKIDTIYSSEYVLFTKDRAISYINNSKYGMLIEDVEQPTDKEKVVTSAKSIQKNSSGYAVSFKSSSKTTQIESEDDFDNEKVTVYVVKGNTLYSLSSKNSLTKLKSLKSVSTSSSIYYSRNNANIGFSEWGDLVLIDSAGVVWFNEKVDNVKKIEVLKDQDEHTVQAKYFTSSSGIIKNVILTDGSTVKLEKD